MANFTNQDVMKLREITSVGMMDCKKALVETDGDMEAAIKYLREKGMASAAKKADRIAAEGLAHCFVSEDKKTGVAIEINCETDFVARSDKFVDLINKIASHILSADVKTLDELLASKLEGKTVTDFISEAVASIGEKISIRRFEKFALGEEKGIEDSYVHMGGKIAVLVELKSDSDDKATLCELAHNLGMQITASNPTVISIADVDPVALEKEREILTAQSRNEGKPEAVIAKMVEGRINKYYKEVCLLEQPYVKGDEQSVKQVIAQVEQQLGHKITVSRFVRYAMGEGIEKRVDNYIDEIAAQVSSIK